MFLKLRKASAIVFTLIGIIFLTGCSDSSGLRVATDYYDFQLTIPATEEGTYNFSKEIMKIDILDILEDKGHEVNLVKSIVFKDIYIEMVDQYELEDLRAVESLNVAISARRQDEVVVAETPWIDAGSSNISLEIVPLELVNYFDYEEYTVSVNGTLSEETTAPLNLRLIYQFEILSPKTVFGIQLIDQVDFWALLVRFGFNMLVILIAVRLLYYPLAKRKDYLFTYVLLSSIIFLLCFLLDNVKLQIGFALGLFAIFGIIRYRTNPIPIKEMTYLFLIIGISVINALANKKVSYAELIFTNFIILIICFLLERVFLLKHESTKTIVYEKIDLIKRERRAELLADLEERTGLKINRIEIGRINFLRDAVRIKIHYFEEDIHLGFDTDDYGSSEDNGF